MAKTKSDTVNPEVAELIKYVWDVYRLGSLSEGKTHHWGGFDFGPASVAPIEMSEIEWAVARLVKHAADVQPRMTDGMADTFGREMVRDLILYQRGVEISNLEHRYGLRFALYGRPSIKVEGGSLPLDMCPS